ncbi:MAG: TetR/AcrR family transcriptional regulator [Deltaproteobacteria bacterium]|nr:TetR/AcrR family transcriptional regulator [Deltaproteobacteria bacterium]
MTARKIKKRMTKDERMRHIVDAASMLFAKNGFKGTTTREIAKKAGISEAVIFKHFSKKEALYSAIIDSRCNDTAGHSRLMKILEGKSGKDVFYEVANFLITEHQEDPSFLRLLTFSALEGHNLSDIFIKTKGMELIEFLAGHIKELVNKKLFRRVEPIIAARAFMGMVLHYSISQEIYGLKKYFKMSNDYVIDTFVDIFFNGMERH